MAVVLVAATGTAAGQQAVTGCETLDTPGESYVLDGDVQNQTADTCIEITANGVSLDGNGYTVDGVNGTGGSTGVLVRSSDDVVVENLGNVTGWETGLVIGESVNATVTDNVVNANSGDGIALLTGWSTVQNNTANRNGGIGTRMASSFENNLTGNTFVENAEAGLFVGSSNNNVFSENVAEEQQVGILVQDSLGNSFENDTSRNNDIDFLDTTSGEGGVPEGAVEPSHALNLNSVESLNIGDSVKPSTAVSFEAVNFAVGGVEHPPENPEADPAGRYFGAAPTYLNPPSTPEGGDTVPQETRPAALLNVSLHYGDSDVSGIDETSLRLWAYNFESTNWMKLVDIDSPEGETMNDSTVDTSENAVRWRFAAETSPLGISSVSTEGGVSINEHGSPLVVFGAFGNSSDCTSRRSLGRGEEGRECPSDRSLSRGETRRDLDRSGGRNGVSRGGSDTARRSRGR